MALATKRIHNLPPHLTYVSTLPDITQKPKHDNDELKQRLINTVDCIPYGIIDKVIDQWQTWLLACLKAKEHHFKHQSDLATQLALFQTLQNWFLSEPLTILRERQHNFNFYVMSGR